MKLGCRGCRQLTKPRSPDQEAWQGHEWRHSTLLCPQTHPITSSTHNFCWYITFNHTCRRRTDNTCTPHLVHSSRSQLSTGEKSEYNLHLNISLEGASRTIPSSARLGPVSSRLLRMHNRIITRLCGSELFIHQLHVHGRHLVSCAGTRSNRYPQV